MLGRHDCASSGPTARLEEGVEKPFDRALGLPAPFFERHRWGPNLDGLSEWVPGARFGRSKSHLNFWALLGVGLDPGPKWALGGLLGSPGGPRFVPKKIKVDLF